MHVVMPGASSMRGVTGYRVVDAVCGALAQLVPDRIAAAGEGGTRWRSSASAAGRRVGLQRARRRHVGRAARLGRQRRPREPGEPRRKSRSRWPRRSGRSWSSGTARAGLRRRGPVPRRARGRALWRCLTPGTTLHVRSDRASTGPTGSTAAARARLVERAAHPDGSARSLPPMFGPDRARRRPSTDRGGGGWGDPLARDPPPWRGTCWTTRSSSRRRAAYGVVVAADGSAERRSG